LQNTVARPVGGVSFGLKGRILIAGGSGGYDAWDLASSPPTFIPSHRVKYLYGCVCDPLGQWVYVSDSLGGFRILPLDGRGARRLPGSPYQHHVVSFALTPDGGRLVVSRGGAGLNRVECWAVRRPGSFDPVWSIRDGEPIAMDEPYLLNQAGWFTNAVAVSPDGTMVATAESRSGGGTSGTESLLVTRDGGSSRTSAELGKSATSFDCRLAFAPDGGTLFAWDKRVIERWDVATGRRTGERPALGRAYFRGLAIHPAGILLTASGDGQARYWDPATISPVEALKWPVGKLHSVAISSDGMLAAAGGDKGQVVLWDVDV
jgi:WD40 repeat protein